MMQTDQLRALVAAASTRSEQIRQHIHQHPELSGQEARTSQLVADRLNELGFTVETGVGGGYGVIGTIRQDLVGKDPGVALRADMDALPIQEETGVPYASQVPGVMHACTHDAHVAMLLGTAQVLAELQRELKGPVRLLFQPAEETVSGAAQIISGGGLEDMAAVFGLHSEPSIPVGTVATRVGPNTSAVGLIDLTFEGRGGHTSQPHLLVDPVPMLCACVLHSPSAVRRAIPADQPVVTAFNVLRASDKHNIVPDSAYTIGDIRAPNTAVVETALQTIERMARGIAASHNGTVSCNGRVIVPAIVNDPRALEFFVRSLDQLFGNKVDPNLSKPFQYGEDFSRYGEPLPDGRTLPTLFFWLGLRNPGEQSMEPLHTSRRNFNPAAMPVGIGAEVELARRFGEFWGK